MSRDPNRPVDPSKIWARWVWLAEALGVDPGEPERLAELAADRGIVGDYRACDVRPLVEALAARALAPRPARVVRLDDGRLGLVVDPRGGWPSAAIRELRSAVERARWERTRALLGRCARAGMSFAAACRIVGVAERTARRRLRP